MEERSYNQLPTNNKKLNEFNNCLSSSTEIIKNQNNFSPVEHFNIFNEINFFIFYY